MQLRHARLDARRSLASAFRKLVSGPAGTPSGAPVPFRRRALIEALEPRMLMSADLPGLPPPPSIADTTAPVLAFSSGLSTSDATTSSFAPLPPAGGLVHGLDVTDEIVSDDGISVPVARTFAFESDRSVGVRVDGVADTLQVRLRVLDADGGVVAEATGTGLGAAVALPSAALPGAGDYTIEVAGVDGSAGSFRLRAVIDAVLEFESTGGIANDTAATAQSADDLALALGGGATRLAIAGTLGADESEDWYSATLASGDLATFVAAGTAALRLELHDASGTLVAVGVPETGSDGATAQVAIRDFAALSDGAVQVRVVRPAGGAEPADADYQLVATRRAHFDAPAAARATDITRTGIVLGSVRTSSGTGTADTPWTGAALFDGEGWRWDVQGNGSISDGTSDAYDGGVILEGFDFAETRALEVAGRQVALGPQTVFVGSELETALDVERRIYVSPTGGFARFLESFTNTGETTVVYRASVFTNLGSDGGTQQIAESSGDGFVDASDRWVITDDSDGFGDPTMLHVIGDDGGIAPASFTRSGDSLRYAYDLEIVPGATVSLLHFAAQSGSRALAQAKVATLTELVADTLVGLTRAQLDSIVNFDVSGVTATADTYTLEVVAGDEIVLETTTPGDAAGEPDNAPTLGLAVTGPDGVAVGAVSANQPDGRNARLAFSAVATGTYRIEVRSADPRGDYVLRATGATGTPTAVAPQVVASIPASGEAVFSTGTLELEFDRALLATSVDAADLELEAGVTATSVEFVDGRTLRFTLEGLGGSGSIEWALGPGAVSGLDGAASLSASGVLVLDQTGPAITDFSARVGGDGLFAFDFEFDEAIEPASLGPGFVMSFTGPDGADLSGALGGVYFDNEIGRVVVGVSRQIAEGEYVMRVGPSARDGIGNFMDQDGDGANGEDEDVFEARFTLALPDLVPVGFVAPPSTAEIGESLLLVWEVRNDGNGRTGETVWYDEVWVSADDVFDPETDRSLGAYFRFETLGPGETASYSANVFLPLDLPLGAGPAWFFVGVDNYGYIAESDETNNVLAIGQPVELTAPAAPNLVVTDITAPATAQNGTSVEVSWVTANTGDDAVTSGWYETLYLSALDGVTPEIELATVFRGGPLEAGAELPAFSVTRTIPIDLVGERRFVVATDVFNNHFELGGETDNVAIDDTTILLTQPPLPDLVVENLAIDPVAGTFGQQITVTFDVANRGVLDANNFWRYDGLVLSRDTVYGGDDLSLGDAYTFLTQLAVGAVESRSITVTLPQRDGWETDSYHLLVRADVYGNLREDSEANNDAGVALEVTAPPTPDLIVTEITAPETAQSDDTVEVRWTVRNQGAGALDGRFNEYVYLSSADGSYNFDRYLGVTTFTGRIEADASVERSFSVRLPIDTIGNRRIVIVTDAFGEVFERGGEANNTAADDRPIAITLLPLPDLVVSDIVAPAEALNGRSLTFSYTVANQGPGDTRANQRYDYVWLSDASGTTTEFYIGRFFRTDAIAAGGSVTYADQSLAIPAGVTGNRRLIISTDWFGNEFEFDRENNNRRIDDTAIAIADPTLPDLDPTAFSILTTGDLAFGQTIEFEWTVANIGNAATSGQWTDRVWLTRNGVIDGNAVFLGEAVRTGDPIANPDGTYTQRASFALPRRQDLGSADYILALRTDHYAQLRELDETNNVATLAVAITQPPSPNLVVSDIVAPDAANTNGPVTLRWTVTNSGDADVTSWVDRVWLSNLAGTGTQYSLGSFRFDGTLAAGESIEREIVVNVPIDALGDRRFVVRTDASGEHFEFGGEEDNTSFDDVATAFTLPPLPDLTVSAVTAPVDAVSGSSITLTWTITNQGTQDIVNGRWSDRVWLSNDTAVGGDQYFGDFRFEGSLAAGASITRSQSIDIPLTYSGVRFVVVQTDVFSEVLEYGTREDNNLAVDDRAITVRQTPLPDLRVTSITPPSAPFSGQETVIQWVTTNEGGGPTSAPVWFEEVWLSLDGALDDSDIYLGRATNPTYLDAGASYANSLTARLPDGLDGNYRFIVRTDAYNYVTELAADENDNVTASADTRVRLTPPPDLQVQTIVAPPTAFSGQPVNLSWTVVNAGEGRTAGGFWRDRVYLSADDVFDASDVDLGFFAHSGALDADATYTTAATVNLPIGISGPHWFFVRTDVFNEVYEHTSEANNLGREETATDITLTPPPDLEVTAVELLAEVVAGRALTIDYEVTNFGATGTPNSVWTDRFWLSVDATLDAGDRMIGAWRHYGALAADAAYTQRVSLDVPFDLSGALYVIVRTDDGDEVFELDNANNTGASAASVEVLSRPANLVVESVTVPTTGNAGDALTVSWSVRNTGTDATVATRWNDQVIVSRDAVLGNADDRVLGTFARNAALAVGALYSRDEQVALPFDLEGAWNVFVVTDAQGEVVEIGGEGDNASAARPVAITRTTANLLPTAVVATPVDATAGEVLRVDWRVDNVGVNRTDANYWYDQVWLSRDGVLDSAADVFLGEFRRANPLASGAGYDGTINVRLPAGLGTGAWTVLVRTDVYGQVTEAGGEGDNLALSAASITVAPADPPRPDLVVESVEAPALATSGNTFSLTWTVRNAGEATGTARWYDAVYLSRDAIFDRATDRYLGYVDRIGALDADGTYTVTRDFTVPNGLTGPFFVFVATDAGGQVNEPDAEANNAAFDDSVMQVDLAPPADLVAGEIDVPANGVPGRNASISYTITNEGTNAARGGWRDSVYLSLDDTWDLSDALFGSVDVSGPLNGGASYTRTLTAPLPGVLPGTYKVLVRSDILNQIPESDDANNLGASLAGVELDAEALTLGVAANGTLGQGQSAWYRVDVEAGETVRVSVDGADGTTNEVYLRFGQMPSRGLADFSGAVPYEADQVAIIPDTRDGTYYVQIFGAQGSGAYSIRADVLPFSITQSHPTVAGRDGTITLEIDGARFNPQTQFELAFADGTIVTADRLRIVNGAKAFATFGFTSDAPLGEWTLRAFRPGSTGVAETSVAGALTLVEGGGAQLTDEITGPSQVRPGRRYIGQVAYGNTGNNDIASPLLFVVSPTGTPMGASAETVGQVSVLQFLGTSLDGPRDILRPGVRHALPFVFESSTDPIEFQVRTVLPDDSGALDFDLVQRSLRFEGLTDAQWDAIWLGQLRPRIGTTWQQYIRLVSDLVDRYSTPEAPIIDVRALFARMYADNADFLPSLQVSGTLRAAGDGSSLGGVSMAIYRDAGDGSLVLGGALITESDGSFTFTGLPPGRYEFRVADATNVAGASIGRYVFDMNRDAREDTTAPGSNVGASGDVTGLVLYAMPQPAPVAAPVRDVRPQLTVDDAGRTHVFFMRDGQLWHAVDNAGGAGWEQGAPIEGATDVNNLRVTSDARLIDGDREGVLAAWTQGEGNASEIWYVVGERTTTGSWRFTAPTRLTDNAVFEGDFAITTRADGDLVFLNTKQDISIDDDSDLYSRELSVDAPEFVASLLEQLNALEQQLDAMSDAELEALGIHRLRYSQAMGPVRIPQWIPILGSAKPYEADIRFDFTGQIDCTVILQGNGAVKLKVGDAGELELRAGGDARWETNKTSCVYEFKNARVAVTGGGALNVTSKLATFPLNAFFGIGTAVGEALDRAGFRVRFEAAVGVNFIWDAGASFPSWPTRVTGAFRLSAGINFEQSLEVPWVGKVKVTGRALGNGNFTVAATNPYIIGLGNPPASVSILIRAEAKLWGLKRYFDYTGTWPSSDISPLSADGALTTQSGGSGDGPTNYDQTFTISNGPAIFGTLNDYGSALDRAVTRDTGDDTSPSIAKSATGRILSAANTDGGIAIREYDEAARSWTDLGIVPGSETSYNRSPALAFDGDGHAILMWNRIDGTGLDADSTAAEIEAALLSGGDLVWSRLDASTGTWSAPQVMLSNDGIESDIQLSRATDGDVVAAWLASDAPGEMSALRAAVFDGATSTWGSTAEVAEGRFYGAPALSTLDGLPLLVWSSADTALADATTPIDLSFSTFDGVSWSVSADLEPTLAAEHAAEVAVQTAIAEAQARADADVPLVTSSLPFSPPENCCDPNRPPPPPRPPAPPYRPPVVVPRDPNDILGPDGFGPERWITARETIPYTIRFENAADASAPAQEVVITQQLDADLDFRTLRFDDFGFGDLRIDLDGTRPFINQRIDLTDTRGFVVDVSASIDVTTGVATWRLITIDPATGEKPIDALTGFLPTNDENGSGEGFVSYTVRAKRAVDTATVIDAEARIIFDTEEPIDTPPIFNTLDAGLPASAVEALDAVLDASEFTVRWSGTDDEGGSAIASYDLFVSIDGGEGELWHDDTTLESAVYSGTRGSTYRFWSIARDNAGNVEAAPAAADATTTLAGRNGSIAGVRFEDVDGDGMRDAGEAGLAGWTVYLDANGNGAFDTGEVTQVTADDGSFLFADLAPGAWSVGLVRQTGWRETTPAGELFDFTITDGNVFTGADFGGVLPGSIAGVKFEDIDGDGQRDAGEGGLEGWTIFLDADRDGTHDAGERSTRTDADGRYAFADLLPGSYVVAEVARAGWVQTAPAVSAEGGLSVLLTSSDSTLELSTPSCACGGSWSASTATDGVAGTDLGALAMRDALALTGIADLRADLARPDLDGRGVRTVVIDTGIDVDHEFFGPDADGNGVADRIVYQWDFAENDGDASDRDGHGSHVASVIGGADDRYGGVADATELIVLKVFDDDGRGVFRDLERALQWVVRNAEAWNIGVVNLSLGDSGNWTDDVGRYGLADEFAALSRADLIVVGAAGNSYATRNAMGVAYPAADPAVIAVGATWAGDFGGPWRFGNGSVDYTTDADRIAGFSQRDTELLDTFAPGARFNGADANGGVRTMQGTSQAAAFVSGSAAIAQQVALETLGRRLTTGEFAQLLRATGADIVDGDDEDDNVVNTGATYQRLDLQALVAAIGALPVTPPDGGSGGGGDDGGSGTPGGGGTTPVNTAAPGVHSVDLTAGQSVDGLDFGNFELGSIAGRVVDDVDLDGTIDAGETGLAGRTVFLDADGDATLDDDELSATTGSDGRFTFSGVVGPGAFTLMQQVPAGWIATGDGTVEITLASGESRADADLTQAQDSFRVTGVEVTASGFHASFNRAFDAALVNLYGTRDAGAPDVVVMRTTPTGEVAVRGNLVLDADRRGFTFVRTGGPLPAGEYTVRLASRVDGFVDAATGALLDGDADTTSVGGDHVARFTVGAVGLTLGLPDVMRAPGQALGTVAHRDGLAVRLSDGSGVSTVDFTVRFDPTLVAFTGVVARDGTSATLEAAGDGAVRVRIATTGGATLPAGAIDDLVRLQGTVLASAPYGRQQVLDVSDIVVNGGALVATDDDAVHATGLFGDTDGDGAYSQVDLVRLQRVIARQDPGLAAWPNLDPVIAGDFNGNGTLTATDASRLQFYLAGRLVPEIPALPSPAPLASTSTGGLGELQRNARSSGLSQGGQVNWASRFDGSAPIAASVTLPRLASTVLATL
jgi:subtilase family serine protease